jgi:hypothetical protein
MEALQLVNGPPAFRADSENDFRLLRQRFEDVAQKSFLLRFRQDDANITRKTERLWEFYRSRDFGWDGTARLLCRLSRDPPPSLGALYRCGRQMYVRALGDHGHNVGNTEFRAFLDGPLHPVKLKNGKGQCNFRGRGGRHLFAKFKLNPTFRYRSDSALSHRAPGRDIKFLPHASAEHTCQMFGVVSGEDRAIARYFVGDPSAASHESGASTQC